VDETQAGRIEATLTHIAGTMGEIKEEQVRERDRASEHRDRIHSRINDLAESTSSGLTSLHADHAGLKASFESHVKHDDQRFSQIWRILKIVGPVAVAAVGTGAYSAI